MLPQLNWPPSASIKQRLGARLHAAVWDCSRSHQPPHRHPLANSPPENAALLPSITSHISLSIMLSTALCHSGPWLQTCCCGSSKFFFLPFSLYYFLFLFFDFDSPAASEQRFSASLGPQHVLKLRLCLQRMTSESQMGKLQTESLSSVLRAAKVETSGHCCSRRFTIAIFVQKCSELEIELLRNSIFRLFSQQGSGQIHLTSVF